MDSKVSIELSEQWQSPVSKREDNDDAEGKERKLIIIKESSAKIEPEPQSSKESELKFITENANAVKMLHTSQVLKYVLNLFFGPTEKKAILHSYYQDLQNQIEGEGEDSIFSMELWSKVMTTRPGERKAEILKYLQILEKKTRFDMHENTFLLKNFYFIR